jgi:hypothetical protein
VAAETYCRRRVRREPAAVDDHAGALDSLVRADLGDDGWQEPSPFVRER